MQILQSQSYYKSMLNNKPEFVGELVKQSQPRSSSVLRNMQHVYVVQNVRKPNNNIIVVSCLALHINEQNNNCYKLVLTKFISPMSTDLCFSIY